MDKTLAIISRTIGWLSTIAFICLGVFYFNRYVFNPPRLPLDRLFFEKIRFETALETVKILLPLTSGYLLATAPIMKYINDKKGLWTTRIKSGLIMTFLFGILALGLWSGVLKYLLDAAYGFQEILYPENYKKANLSWNKVGVFSALAHMSFFTSIVWFVSTSILIFINQNQEKTGYNNA